MDDREYFMNLALSLARKAAARGEVPVGAVIVRGGRVIAKGYNRREKKKNALRHAEMEAINKACRKLRGWRLCGCELYVTLEPCPMCAGAAINARIDRVIIGAADPKNGALCSVARLFELPFTHRPELVTGVLEKECGAVLSDFFRALRAPGAPARK